MSAPLSPTIAISSWCLHRTVGLTWWDSPAKPAVEKAAYGRGSVAILDLPAEVARHDIDRLQVCHFHVARRDKTWLGEFRAALADAGVRLQTLLIDDADITDPANHKRDVAWVGSWIDTAATLGAESARVVAGKQKPTPDALALSVAGLKELSHRGKRQGVRIITENWFDLLAGADEVHHVLDRVGDDLGLLADFGNWKGQTKYDELASIMPRAEDTHAKASFGAKLSIPGAMDGEDYGRCVAVADAAGYDGPYTLVYDGPDDDEWAGIETEAQFIRNQLATGTTRRTA